MKFSVENLSFGSTDITSAKMGDRNELIDLISGDIAISFRDATYKYHDVSILDFAIQLVNSFLAYLTGRVENIQFFSPNYEDKYSINCTSGDKLSCDVIINSEIVYKSESLLDVMKSIRDYIQYSRELLENRYGHIEYIWDSIFVSVF